MIDFIKRLLKREIQPQYSWEYIEIKVLNADLDDCLQRAKKAEALLKHRDILLVNRLQEIKELEDVLKQYEARVRNDGVLVEDLIMKMLGLEEIAQEAIDSIHSSIDPNDN